MTVSFIEDPLNQCTLAGIKKKEELLYQHAILQIRHAAKTGTLYLLDGNPKAMMVFADSAKTSSLSEILLNVSIIMKTLLMLDAADRKIMISNHKKTKEVINFTWHNSFIKGRFYRLKITAIDKEMRGTGAFRRLITPRIELCDQHNLPIVVETHNPKNLGLYNHFGFELVKTISSTEIEIEQYCMIRFPNSTLLAN